MLQNPSAKSNPCIHSKYSTSRLVKWKDGNIQSLMKEPAEIQSRLKTNKGNRKNYSQQIASVKLMLFGKVGEAAKKVNDEDSDRVRRLKQ